MSFLLKRTLPLVVLICNGSAFADIAPVPPRFKQPVVVAFNNNYLGLVEENIPVAMANPENTEKYLFALIDSATSTLSVAFYDITDLPAADRIIKAHQRGIKVRVITDTDNMRDKEDPTKPSEASRRMRRAKVPVQDDRRGAFMHHKFVVADGEAVWLGSMNLTPTSIYEHNNNGIIIRSKRVASNFEVEFGRLFNDRSFSGVREPVPFPETTIGGAAIRTYFSPNGGTREAILKEIKKARKSIQVMAFVFTDNELADAILARHKKGVKVEGVFDECLIDSRSHYYTFRSAGMRVRRDGNQALMHHKVIIIDEKIVITGSYNFTNAAEQYNNESVVIINSRDIASAYADEFSRLMEATFNNRNLPSYDHPACRRGARN